MSHQQSLGANSRSPFRWTSVAVLRRLWVEDLTAVPDPRLEGAFDAVTEDIVDAITSDSSDRLLAGYQDLRKFYSSILAQGNGPGLEDVPGFSLGRLVALLDIAADAVRRLLLGPVNAEVVGILNNPSCIRLLQALYEREGSLVKSSDLASATGIEKSYLSRLLSDLEDGGFVTTRKLGKHRLSRLTRTGIEVARQRFGGGAAEAPLDQDESYISEEAVNRATETMISELPQFADRTYAASVSAGMRLL